MGLGKLRDKWEMNVDFSNICKTAHLEESLDAPKILASKTLFAQLLKAFIQVTYTSRLKTKYGRQ